MLVWITVNLVKFLLSSLRTLESGLFLWPWMLLAKEPFLDSPLTEHFYKVDTSGNIGGLFPEKVNLETYKSI